MALALTEQGSYSDAMKLFKKVLSTNPRMALAQYYMAKVAYLQKKYTDAEKYATQAIENDPHLLDASLLLIDTSLKQKKYDQARTALLHIRQAMDNNRISKFIDEQLSVIGS